jgi:hypothetical protein
MRKNKGQFATAQSYSGTGCHTPMLEQSTAGVRFAPIKVWRRCLVVQAGRSVVVGGEGDDQGPMSRHVCLSLRR